ncbi:MAG: serine/threonine-protein kinase [Bacteroidota bacterium]
MVAGPAGGGQIGRYRLIGLLATGGMAQVFLALSGELSGFRTLAVVKRVLPHLASNAQFIRMFFDEARIAALLDHPNIARIIEIGQDNDEYFLAMEVVQGRPLSAVLRKGVKRDRPLTHAQAAFIVAQAANGLGYAHNLADVNGRHLNVVHRDVSPQNILVSFEGVVKVIDFGVARALGRVTETLPGGLKGKIQYMAPEQATAGTVDRRSDVFALGVVLWEALCGRRLFRRDSDMDTLRAIVNEPIVAPSKIGRISPRLERIVMQALEKDPAKRFQDAQEMALALERHAFATEGFSPPQIAAAMKELFASDHLRWKRTVAAAMDLEGAPEQWSKTSGTFLRPRDIDLQTRGPTVALHRSGPHPVPTPPLERREHASDHPSSSTGEFSLPDAPSGKAGRRVAAGVAAVLVALLIAIAWLMVSSPSTVTVTVVRPAASAPLSLAIEALGTTSSPVVVSPAEPALQRTTADQPPAIEIPGEGTPPPPPPPSLSPSSSPSSSSPPPDLDAPIGARSHRGAPITDDLIANFAPAPAIARLSTKKSTPLVARARGGAGTPRCLLKVGSRPWAEVWIDGKNTGGHTPYTQSIACGTHKLTFKRPDLQISKTISMTVEVGETFKESIPLDQD